MEVRITPLFLHQTRHRDTTHGVPDLKVNRAVTPPPQVPWPARNGAPAPGAYLQPAEMSVSGRFRPTNCGSLVPLQRRLLASCLQRSSFFKFRPFVSLSESYAPGVGGANARPRRNPTGCRSQIPQPSRSSLESRSRGSEHSLLFGRANLDPDSRLYARDAHADADGHYLRPRGKGSKKKSKNLSASAQGSSSQGPLTSAPGTAANSDNNTAFPPPPLTSPISIPATTLPSPDQPAVRRSPFGSPPRSGVLQSSGGSLTLPPFSPSNADHVLNRPNGPQFLPQDPFLRNYVSLMISPPNVPRVPSKGEIERGRPSVRGRNSHFRSNTGSVSPPRVSRD